MLSFVSQVSYIKAALCFWFCSFSPSCPSEQDYYPEQKPPIQADVTDFEELHNLILSAGAGGERKFQIVDSRPPAQFSGIDAQSGVSGHMPFALNVPLSSILGPNKQILPAADLKATFEEKGVQNNLPTILSCNTGTTAAAVELALRVSGYDMDKTIYDGSWMEWRERAQKAGLIIVD